MVDIRCPKCGKKTTLRASRTSGRSYFICLNYPKCRGRVPVEEDLSGAWSEENPAPEPAGDSDRESLEQDPGDEDWSGGWGEASRTPEPALVQPRQVREPVSAKSGGGTAVRKSGKAKRGSDAGVKRPERKSRVPVEENWGDDWDDERPAPKPAADRARRHVAPKPEVAPEKKEPPRSRSKIVAKKEEQPEPQRQKAPKPASYKPQYKRGLKAAPVLPQEPEISKPAPDQTLFKRAKRWETVSEEQGREETQPAPSRAQYRRKPKAGPVLPQEPEKPKPAPYRPLYQKPPRWGTLPEEKGQSESQGQMGSQPASYRPQYKRGLKSAPVALQGPGGPPLPPYRPLFPRAEKRGLSSGKQESPKPRRHKAPKAAHEEPLPQKAPKPVQERPQQPKP
jgi:ssDNA-binding Zn-finger/Zn-ribbon topoisomerase 1